MSNALYRRVELLNRERHAGLRLRRVDDIGYAANLRDCPVVVDEFREAAKSYPIVFARDQAGVLMALAVMGFPGTGNLWVDAAGQWRPHHYVPAYVRRYPFAAVESEGEFFLGLDMDFAGVGAEDGDALFEADGTATATLGEAGTFIQGFLQAHGRTQAFLAELERLQLLRPLNAEVWPGEGQMPTGLQNLLYIDLARLDDLRDCELVDFVRQGHYALAVIQTASLTNFRTQTALMGPSAPPC